MALVGRYETNYPVKLRAWTGGTLQETKIPHVPESMSRPPRWDSHRALISSPAFQRLNHAIGNKSEEDMEPILMQPPRRQGHPHRVTKTEKLNVLRECQWQVSDGDARDEDERACARTPLTRSLIILLTAVCVTSLLSIILTLLLLFGTVGSTSCSCNGSSQGASSFEKEDSGYVDEMRRNMTSLEKRLLARIELLEKGSKENDKLVTHNFGTLRNRLEVEERKSNESSKMLVRHSQDIAALQSSLNSSREDIGKLSLVWISVNSTQKELQQQKQLLGLAENSIEKEIHKVWTAVNASNTGIQQQLMKVKYNLTTQLNNTRNLFQSRDTSLFATLVDVNTTLTDKVNNVTKMPGPAGPRGYNGSQGLPGAQGPVGPPGSRGAGNFSQCRYLKADSGGTSAGPLAATSISVSERIGKKIVGATCSTDHAAEYIFEERMHGGIQRYSCQCRGQAARFPSLSGSMHCYLHYWECPTTP